MQAQKSIQLVSIRFIALAFALLVALLLASAAGYVIRGGGSQPAGSIVAAPATVHFQQQSDNQMERAKASAEAAPKLTSPYGAGH